MENFKSCDIKIENPYGKEWARGFSNVNVKNSGFAAELIEKLNQCFLSEQKNLAYICYYLNTLKKLFDDYKSTYYGRFFDKKCNSIFYETVLEGFGLSEKEASRYLNIYDRFIEIEDTKTDIVPKLKSAFFGYSKSKLLELLPLSDSQIKTAFSDKKITVKSTCADIRAYVKSLRSGSSKAEKVLEESTQAVNDIDPESSNANCQLYVTFKKSNLDYIKGLGVKLDDYVNQLIEEDIANRSIE